MPDITQTRDPEKLPEDPADYTGNLTLGSLTGPWVGPAKCLSDHKATRPPIPYGPGNANQNMSSLVEEGYKRVRGQLTEGRFLTFETGGKALTNSNGRFVGIANATERHDDIRQRWVINAVDGSSNTFYIQSALDRQYISGLPDAGGLTRNYYLAQAFSIDYNPYGATYSLSIEKDGQSKNRFVAMKAQRPLTINRSPVDWDGTGSAWFEIFSVSYQ